MHILITGGAGFLGTQLTQALLASKDAGTAPIPFDSILSVDLTTSQVTDKRVTSAVGDITDPAFINPLINENTVAIYHLAAVLSGGSAQNFDAAMAVNIDATRLLLEAARTQATTPRFIFTSSLAVFGGDVPDTVPATYGTQPTSTYGATKAIGELLVNEYSRKGYIHGLTCRLPTISVRPGSPNSAASSFASGIIREPLNGLPSTCPVPHNTRMWLSSPNTIITNLLHALTLPTDTLPTWRVLNMPGISVTVCDMLAALEDVAGQDVRALVTDEPNQDIMDIVCSWPGAFDVSQELALGFTADTTYQDIIIQHQNSV
ncbi:D-erythronate dehydrogenase [Rothia nasimurium]|uniref:D-erythronate dehydrogenase n=1 Tax=Rothia nasimurium TaxID=85336 RepID=UPI003B9DDECE